MVAYRSSSSFWSFSCLANRSAVFCLLVSSLRLLARASALSALLVASAYLVMLTQSLFFRASTFLHSVSFRFASPSSRSSCCAF